MLRLLILITSCGVLAGCEIKKPEQCYLNDTCGGGSDAPGPGSDSASGCMESTDCKINTIPACDTTNHVCVECFGDMTARCSGKKPVCTNDLCAPCIHHADCKDSNACLSDGSCASDTQVAYVDPAGTDTPNCTKSAPCTKVMKALDTGRPYIKFHGTTNQEMNINGRTVTLLADTGARLNRTSNNGAAILIMGTSTVEINDLQITGGQGMNGAGIFVPMNNNVTLHLRGVTVSQNEIGGVVTGGNNVTITIEASTISDNQGIGVNCPGTTLSISRSQIFNNEGGIFVSGLLDITNNFIYRNNNPSSTIPVGGASIVPLIGSRFEYNTIVDNRIQNTAVSSGGVQCNVVGFTAPNNLVARNYVNNDATKTNANTNGACTYPTSTITEQTVTAFKFISPDAVTYDYHIMSGSSAMGQATTQSMITVDFDNQTRHVGASDQGADEYQPP